MFTSKLFQKIFLLILGIVAVNVLALYMLAAPLIRQASLHTEMEAARGVLGGVDELVRSLASDLAAYREHALDARKRQIRDIAVLAAAAFSNKDDAFQASPEAKSQAMKKALEEVGRMRFGDGDFVFVADQYGVLQSYPDRKSLGASPETLDNEETRHTLTKAITEAKATGESMVVYPARDIRSGKPIEKLSYFLFLPAWNVIVGAGSSLDGVNAEVARRKEEMKAFLRETLSRIKTAGSGYLFIFDENENMIAHPDLAGTNLKGVIDPATGGLILQELKDAASLSDPRLEYKWDNSDDRGNRVYEKIAWVRHNEEFNWYIVYSVYADDLGEGAAFLRSRLAAITAIILLASALMAGFMARRMAQPVNELSRTAQKIRGGDLSARCGVRRNDEIGVLSATFNEMAAEMESFVGDLDEKVRERTREVERKNVLLNLQVAERKRVEEDLRQSQSELREAMSRSEGASRAKSEFLADMSHEIRTPMNAIMGMCGLALSAPLPEKQRERLEIIRASADDLLGIVFGILDFSKIEAGKVDLDERPMDLRRVLGDVVDMFRDQVRQKDLEFILDVDGRVPERVFGDALKLKQILTNLTANAFRFTDQGGVTIRVEPVSQDEEAGVLGFSVIDTGSGMRAEDLSGIFEAFAQVDSARGGRSGGTGLGLAISKRLAELMGGGITVRSQPGRGSEFIFTAPLAPVAGDIGALASLREAVAGKRALAAAMSAPLANVIAVELSRLGFAATAAAGPEAFRRALDEVGQGFDLVALERSLLDEADAQAVEILKGIPGQGRAALVFIDPPGKEDRRLNEEFPEALHLIKPVKPSSLFEAAGWFFNREESAQPSGPGMTEPDAGLAGAEILLVEDIAVNRQVAIEVLRMAGIEADVALDGREAVKAVVRKRYDAILMDLQMPVMNGYEATAAIRSLPAGRKLPIIAMTAYVLEGDRERCLEAGMDDYLAKPVNWSDLIKVLTRWIEPKRTGATPAETAETAETAGGAESPSGLVDFAEGLARLGGNTEVYRRVLNIFARSFSGQTSRVAEALKVGDMDQARAGIHALAGAAGNISAKSLRLSAKRVETRILDNETDAALVLLEEAAALLAGVEAEIRAYASEGDEGRGASG